MKDKIDEIKKEYHSKTIVNCEEAIKREKEKLPYTSYSDSVVKAMERKIKHSKKILGG